MDENDKNILRHLMEDGRKSNVDIADAMGVSEETVRRRKVSLQRDGVYEIVAVPDYHKLGYGVEILLGIEADLAGLYLAADHTLRHWSRRWLRNIHAV